MSSPPNCHLMEQLAGAAEVVQAAADGAPGKRKRRSKLEMAKDVQPFVWMSTSVGLLRDK